MIVCDICGEPKQCSHRDIEGKEYDICSDCWEPLAAKLKGKGRVAKKREVVLLPSTPAPEPEPAKHNPPPEGPPKIWARA
jgi:ribosome-binding protein aMBF1 (putative translation factor)